MHGRSLNDLTDNRADVIRLRRAASESTHGLADALDDFCRTILQMGFYEFKSSARTKLSSVDVGRLRNAVAQEDKGVTVVQWDGRMGVKPIATEET
jgi:hypothetical protein